MGRMVGCDRTAPGHGTAHGAVRWFPSVEQVMGRTVGCDRTAPGHGTGHGAVRRFQRNSVTGDGPARPSVRNFGEPRTHLEAYARAMSVYHPSRLAVPILYIALSSQRRRVAAHEP